MKPSGGKHTLTARPSCLVNRLTARSTASRPASSLSPNSQIFSTLPGTQTASSSAGSDRRPARDAGQLSHAQGVFNAFGEPEAAAFRRMQHDRAVAHPAVDRAALPGLEVHGGDHFISVRDGSGKGVVEDPCAEAGRCRESDASVPQVRIRAAAQLVPGLLSELDGRQPQLLELLPACGFPAPVVGKPELIELSQHVLAPTAGEARHQAVVADRGARAPVLVARAAEVPALAVALTPEGRGDSRAVPHLRISIGVEFRSPSHLAWAPAVSNRTPSRS